MSGYIGAIPTPQATQSRDVYTATSNQTTFTTQGYTPGFVSVYLNGVHLARADFTATNGSDVVLASGATVNDTVEIVSFGTFQSADALPLTGGTVTGTVNFPDGSISISDLDIDGGTDIGAALVDADLMVVDDGAGGTNRKATMSRLATYMGTKISGGSQTFTASGSISAGALVGLNADGTISTMGAASGTPVQVNPDFGGSNGAHVTALVYDTTNNKTLFFYRDQQNSSYLTCRVGTVSGTSISFGTAVAITTGVTLMNATFDSNAGKTVLVFEDPNQSADGYAVVVSVSGTTPSFGTPVEFSNADCKSLDVCFDSNANKVVVAYKSNSQGRSRVGTVSGTSISFGTEATFTTSNPLEENYGNMAIAFDSNANKVVIQWTDDGATGDPGTCIVGTVSGTDISFGTAATFTTTKAFHNGLAFDTNSNKFLHVYADSTGTQLMCRVGTISGTDISFGTEKNIGLFGSNLLSGVTFDSNTNRMIIFFEGVTTNFGMVASGVISGTDFFPASTQIAAEVNVHVGSIVFDPDTNQCVCVFLNDAGYNLFQSVFN